MNELFSILIKSSLSLALLYLVYLFFLKKDTFFRTNRFYLVLSMFLSMAVPFIDFSFFLDRTVLTGAVLLDPVIITAETVNASINSNPAAYQVLLAIYLTGAGLFTLRFIYQLMQLGVLAARYGISRRAGMNIIFTNKNYSPFSFFNLIFLNTEDTESAGIQKILAHERVHVKQFHSIDLILLEVITIILWFNPFVWFMRHSLKALHEYLADEGVLHSGVDASVYSALLFEQSTGIQVNDLTNNFSKSLLKRRFAMMNKRRTPKVARLKLLVALPLAMSLLLVLSFSPEVMAQEKTKTIPPPPPKTEKAGDQAVEKKNPHKIEVEEKIYTVVEVMPEFPGGQKALYSYMGENIKYPEEAKKKGLSGTVYVTFIILEDGRVSNAEILRGAGNGFDEEALRVVKAMPKWKPGTQDGKPVNVVFNLPIKFNLAEDKEEKKAEKPESK